MHSFEIIKNIIGPKDKIRVSITTLPELQKQSQTIDFKKMNSISPIFNIKYNENTEKIIIVFRKKSFLGSQPIIASTFMKTEDLKIFENKTIERKKIRIFEPVNESKDKREIVGKMIIELSLEEIKPNNSEKNIKNKTKENNHSKYLKVNSYEKDLMLDNE